MKRKSVLWGAGMVIVAISIVVTFSFQISRLSKTENMDLWRRTRVAKRKSENVVNNAKAEFFRQTAKKNMERTLYKATSSYHKKENNVQFFSETKEEKEAVSYLLSQKISKQLIGNMQNLGYSAKEVVAMWNVCNEPEERRFFLHIMEGTKESYEQAFQIDPNKLSDSITVFLGAYSMRLLQIIENETFIQKTKEQFENFNNAILSSEKTYNPKRKESSLVKRKLLYRDIYLQRMYISSVVEVERRVMALSLMCPEEPDYEKRYETYLKGMFILNLWGSEIILVEKIGNVGQKEAYKLSIHGLKYSKNQGFSLNMRHYSPNAEAFVDEGLSNTMLWQSNDIEDTWSLISLKELPKEKEAAKKAAVIGMISIGVMIVVLLCLLCWRKKRRQR